MKTKILYEDSHLLIIHKPAGIAVQSGRVGQMDVESELRNYVMRQGRNVSAGQGLQNRDGQEQQRCSDALKTQSNTGIYIIHRLDQPVEGLLVVAKTKDAAARLNRQLCGSNTKRMVGKSLGQVSGRNTVRNVSSETSELNKEYMAVVYLGQTEPAETGTFTDFMIKNGQVAEIVAAAGQEATLHYHILKQQEDLALVSVRIETGRFHQIRCQMAYHGMPLLGDVKYGSTASVEFSRSIGIRQTALCAHKLTLTHPYSGKLLSYEVKPENPAFAKFL